MTNTMLDPNSQLTVVNALMAERRRDAADGRLARLAARARLGARARTYALRMTDALASSAPAGEVGASRAARTVGHAIGHGT